ncbi:hypothetical protein BDP81DRAFT_81855 [Colletotrichum phormii]|uniref:Uncharacterized protein n=1 Tax=Colletotrichum phormii TaxID=359342 RepID=A0AAJ0A3I3_9PEZI|nr:uncharacterized protein BDP81DRAFT_81855 [Colletotrichum phormii]KAK1654352.1 hypothetical protein BDP81DRAFT_81855 [Colletotrichum phormii]
MTTAWRTGGRSCMGPVPPACSSQQLQCWGIQKLPFSENSWAEVERDGLDGRRKRCQRPATYKQFNSLDTAQGNLRLTCKDSFCLIYRRKLSCGLPPQTPRQIVAKFQSLDAKRCSLRHRSRCHAAEQDAGIPHHVNFLMSHSKNLGMDRVPRLQNLSTGQRGRCWHKLHYLSTFGTLTLSKGRGYQFFFKKRSQCHLQLYWCGRNC